TDVSAARRADIRRQAEDAGLEIVGLHWLLAKTVGLHLTSPDTGVRARTRDYLIALAEGCRDLGGTIMVFGSPKQRSLLPGVSAEQARDWAVETFRQVAPALADCGVRLSVEPLAPVETDFITTCAAADEIVRRVDHPSVALHL